MDGIEAGLPESMLAVMRAALAAVNPYGAVLRAMTVEQDSLSVGGTRHELPSQGRVLVLGAGKAAVPMARALERLLLPFVDAQRVAGLVVTKYGHGEGEQPLRAVRVIEAAHPVPDAAGLAAGAEILQLAESATANDLVVAVISGGGSALLEALPHGIALDDWQRTTTLLLESGATIGEVNTVRKRLSLVKGGQLARAVYPARMLTLVLSDIVGSPLDAIASGPTVADSTTWQDAWDVVERYALAERLPSSVCGRLDAGRRGRLPETPKTGERFFSHSSTSIVADNRVATAAAAQTAAALGYVADVRTNALEGEASTMAAAIIDDARQYAEQGKSGAAKLPAVLMWGGETTVTLGERYGLGGRNQEMAVAATLALAGTQGITFVALATDGSDGPTDCAGGWADGETATRAAAVGVDLAQALYGHAAYDALKRIGALIHTGPTRTNVNDIAFAFIE